MQRVIRFVLAQMVLACCVPVRLWSQNLLSNGSFDKPAQGVPFVHGSFLHRFVQLARRFCRTQLDRLQQRLCQHFYRAGAFNTAQAQRLHDARSHQWGL